MIFLDKPSERTESIFLSGISDTIQTPWVGLVNLFLFLAFPPDFSAHLKTGQTTTGLYALTVLAGVFLILMLYDSVKKPDGVTKAWSKTHPWFGWFLIGLIVAYFIWFMVAAYFNLGWLAQRLPVLSGWPPTISILLLALTFSLGSIFWNRRKASKPASGSQAKT